MKQNRTSKIQVLLLFGGESSEHDVSLSSARNVLEAIGKEHFNVDLAYIDRQGCWWLTDRINDALSGSTEELMPQLGQGCFIVGLGPRTISPDVILPILHGKNGEDGSVQALGQLLHIPVVGCDMTASAICMDKVATKEMLSANDIPVVPYATHRIGQPEPDYDSVKKELGLPLFVKPARAGSSVGVSKVSSSDQFFKALHDAHQHDAVVLIEQAVSGRELEVAALGNPPHHEVSGVGEILAGSEFYSYDAKYSPDSTSKAIVSADLDPHIAEEIRSLAHKAYGVLGCAGMARLDFFFSDTGSIYLNEVNTIPGFTDISMYPKLWEHAGLPYSELVARLISLALDDTIRAV